MAKRVDKKAKRIKSLFDALNDAIRQRWETVNQKGHDFYLDNQLTQQEKEALEDQGMPTFTVNRIIPVVEMLNYYATSNSPRWQAVGVEQSDSDVASLFADVADYVWNYSNGQTLYSNVVNDSITKGMGFLQVCVDPNADNGMGEVIIQQPDPFDVFVDPKSRDPLYRDASHIIIRKVLPKTQLINMYPEWESKIKKAAHSVESDQNFTKGMTDSNDFQYKDVTSSYDKEGRDEDLIEYFECYERDSTKYCNVFYQKLPSKEQMAEIKGKVDEQLKAAEQEMMVSMQEAAKSMQEQVEAGDMLQERMQLEMEKLSKNNEAELANMQIQLMAEMQKQMSIVDNMVITWEQYKILKDDVTPISNPINKIKQIGGYNFTWGTGSVKPGQEDVGVISQEVEEVMPEVIRNFTHTSEDTNRGATPGTFKSVLYDRMVPLLIEGIKEQQEQIDDLREQLNTIVCGSIDPN